MNPSDLSPLLAANPLFSGLDRSLQDRLAQLFVARRYEAGAAIFRAGDGAHDYYLVLTGRVHVRMAGMPVASRERGDGLGELGFVPAMRRRADAFAGREGCWTAKLPRVAFERLMEENLAGFDSFRRVLEAKLAPLGIAPREFQDRGTMVGSPRVYAFAAPRDGVGRTTLAVNFAAHLAVEGLRVALVDLDPTGGDVTLLTDVDPIRNWTQLFPADGAEPDLSPSHLRETLLSAGGGLWVLPAPPTSASARGPSPEDAVRLLGALGRCYDAVVVDVPSGTGPLAEVAMRGADMTVVVGSYSYQGVFALNRMVAALGRKGLDGDRVQVVLNRLGRIDDVAAPESETLLRPPVVRLLEEAEVARAASTGKPDVVTRPGGGLAQGMRALRARLEGVRRRRLVERETPVERRARGRSLVALGRSLFLKGEQTRAREALQEAALSLPEDSEAPLLLGRLFEDRGQVRQAADWLRVAMEADAEDLHALCRLAHLTRNPALAARAMKRLDPRRERFPHRADYHLLAGLLYEVAEDPASADAAYVSALQVHPGYAEAHRRRGDLAARIGQSERALEHYREGTVCTPAEPAAWAGLTHVLGELGLVGPAFTALRRLAALVPDHPEVQRRDPALRLALKRVHEEVASYDKALQGGAVYPDVLLLRAGARLREGDLRAAAADAARALEGGASLPGARLLLRKLRRLTPVFPATEAPGAAQRAA